MSLKFISNSKDETFEFGKNLIKLLTPPITILLIGDLAAGKTTMTKGMGSGLGIKEVINSPSFNIMKQYKTKDNQFFQHYDFYRMDEVGYDFDLLDYLETGYNVIEWPLNLKELLPKDALVITIDKISENKREFIIKADKPLLEKLKCLV